MTKREKTIACPACGARATFATRADTVTYKGHSARVLIPGYWCGKCGEAVLGPVALQKSEAAFLALRARVEGVLGPRDVTAIRVRLKLSQRRAGELLGGGPRAFQKYEAGTQQVSVPMTNLLRLLARDPRRMAELGAKTGAVRRRRAARAGSRLSEAAAHV